MISSFDYWKTRYKSGQDSGNRLDKYVTYKSDYLNALIKDNDLKSVLDFGHGDGTVASRLEVDEYVGLDIAGAELQQRVSQLSWAAKSKQLITTRFDDYETDKLFDVVICMDVLYHILKHEEAYLRATLAKIVQMSKQYIVIDAQDSKDETMHEWRAGHMWNGPWRQILEDEMGVKLVRQEVHPHESVSLIHLYQV